MIAAAVFAATGGLIIAVAAFAMRRQRAGQITGRHTAHTLTYADEWNWHAPETPTRALEPLPPPARNGARTPLIVAPSPDLAAEPLTAQRAVDLGLAKWREPGPPPGVPELAAEPDGIVPFHGELTEEEAGRFKQELRAAIDSGAYTFVHFSCEPGCDAVDHDLPVYRAVAEGRDRDNQPAPEQVPGPSTAAEGFLAAKGWPTPRGNT